MWKRYSDRFCIEIRPKTNIGKGLRLVHGMCVVVNPLCIIGELVRLFQFVTLGEKDGEVSIIGDNVTIYPNSVVLGRRGGNW